jgi:GDP-6-deoxy-D-talose 4-dehydrogenase
MRHDGGGRFAPQSNRLQFLVDTHTTTTRDMMRIYMTGASGFTGLHLSAYLSGLNHEVQASQADLLDLEALRKEIQLFQPTHVVHLAAIAFIAHADAHALYQTNLLGTRNLLEALQLSGNLQKVLLASSANVYGNSDISPLQETHPAAPANDYAVSKLAMEYLAKLYSPKLPIVIARPFNYTGPGQSASFVIPKLVAAFQKCASHIDLGNLNVHREFNDVRLICSAYELLLTHGQAGSTVNVCSGQMFALQQVIGMLTDLSGHRPEIRVNPAFVRVNEVSQLCGSPALLHKLAALQGYPLPAYSLPETLRWMLDVDS